MPSSRFTSTGQSEGLLAACGDSPDAGTDWPVLIIHRLEDRGEMAYVIRNIGSSFNDRTIEGLVEQLNQYDQQGWDFHSVFMVQHRSCLGLAKVNTYLAVFKQR